MITRQPTYKDIDLLIDLGARLHAESAYAFLPYNEEKVRQLIFSYIEDDETQFGLIAETGDVIIGMIGGYLVEYYFCDEKIACDIVLFVDQQYRGGMAAIRLIRGFQKWAKAHGARELCLGITTNVQTELTGKLYQRLGFNRAGSLYKKRLDI